MTILQLSSKNKLNQNVLFKLLCSVSLKKNKNKKPGFDAKFHKFEEKKKEITKLISVHDSIISLL